MKKNPILEETETEMLSTSLPKNLIKRGGIVDGFLWGRGALDMKGAVAMMLCAFLRAKHENAYLAGPEGLDFAGLIHAADERISFETLTFGSEAIYQLLQCFHE